MERIVIIAGLLSAHQVLAQPLNCDFSTSAEICFQANGSVVASVSGGTPPYAYFWMPEPPTGQGTPSLIGLPSGAYTLTITDALGTEGIFVVNVVHDLSLGWTGAGSYAAAHGWTGFGVPCEGECNGAMAMPDPPLVEGPFLYEWSDPTITQIATSPQGDPVFFGFCADGTYSYTVSNPLGCSSTSLPFTNPVVPDASLWTLGDTIVPSACDQTTGQTVLFQELAWPWPTELVVTNGLGNHFHRLGTNRLFIIVDLAVGTYTASLAFGSSACRQEIIFTIPGVGEGCQGVSGAVHLDGDLDCMQDPGEPAMPGRVLRVDPGGMLAITDAQGNYNMALDDGDYTLTWLDTTSEPTCPAASSIPFSVNGAPAVVDIAATGDGPLDLSITLRDPVPEHRHGYGLHRGDHGHPRCRTRHGLLRTGLSLASLHRVVQTGPGGGVAFSNIQLPDSNVNEAASHGAVGFRIRPTLPLLPGTPLANAADIFFDFNAPIRTNTSTLMATMATGVAERTEHKMHLFPNPTTGHFTVALEGQELALLRLFSTDGRLAVQQRLTGTRVELALAGLAPGAYRAEVRTADGAVYQRSVLVQ
ncbi:MAG: T9SS type A sorting domain-containing protein [Flavobacteriales bacterium]|nr:T9SS type A sorting domain-containing protein [Flavobacteriales bacterium]